MEKYNLFLDDIRNPEACLNYKTNYMPENRMVYSLETWIIVRNYQEFIDTLKENFESGKFPKLISFDHDLAEIHYDPDYMQEEFSYYEETGSDCAKYLVQFCLDKNLDLPEYYVHSSNPSGRERIHQDMQDYFRYKKILENDN